jgi:[CysO sulfur-carrier protein]-S-L-cysteine hydrolase
MREVALVGEFTIRRDIVDAIIAHAEAGLPDMACGLVAGPCGSDRPERFIPMDNAERSPTFWSFDVVAQLRAWREMAERAEEPVIIYYSAATGEAYPSRTTVTYASEPQAHYLIVSAGRYPVELRSFRIETGEVTEEPIHVVAS